MTTGRPCTPGKPGPAASTPSTTAIDDWAPPRRHLAPHLIQGEDYRRGVAEALTAAERAALRGDDPDTVREPAAAG